jgi:lipopolysaccharide export system protein LptA
MKKFSCAVIPLLVSFLIVKAQAPPVITPATDTSKRIDIINADRLSYKKIDSVTEYQTAVGHAVFKNENTTFYCDSAVYNKNKNIVEAFGNVHINDADSVHTYSNYLIYYGDEKKAILKKKVKLTDGKGVLTTEELEYLTEQKIGTYTNGGKIVNGSTVLTSKEATYFSDLKDAYFKTNVKLRDPQYKVDTDSLLYNTETQIATFVTKTFIEDSSKRKVITSEGYYDLKNKNASFSSRPVIVDGVSSLTGDVVSFDDKTGLSYATGNAVFKDTVQGISIIANDLRGNKNEGTLLATQRPLMIIKQNNDSLYVTADTLFSGRLDNIKGYRDTLLVKDTLKNKKLLPANNNDTANSNRYFQAFHHVRLFSDSLQGVCDSLFYSGKDSVFRMYNEPVLWANGTQVTGDTIFMFTKNKQAERLYVFENAMAVNKNGENYYNQLKGNTLNCYFDTGVINYIRAKGSAETIYYLQDDDSAYAGVNRASSDIIDMRFLQKALDEIVFISEATGTTYPMRQVEHSEMRLRNFKWKEGRRPKTRFELFEDAIEQ